MTAPGPASRGSGAPASELVDADAIVVGAGPNGLVAANLLADAGWSVIVLEANDEPGGSVRSAELIEPGFQNDVCSAFYPLAGEGSPIDDLHLDRHGLRWLHAPTVLAHPVSDGSCPIISRDLAATAASLDALHPGDGAAWEGLMQRWTDRTRSRVAIGSQGSLTILVSSCAARLRELGGANSMRRCRMNRPGIRGCS